MKEIYEEINDESIKKEEEIKKINSKNKVLNANKFEYKAVNALGFALLPYIITVLSTNHLANIGIIPTEFAPVISMGIPAIIGITASGLLNKKNNISEKTSEFTSAKSYKEILEEETLNEIENKKLISEIRILSDVKKNAYFYEQTMEKYENFDSEVRTEEEIEKNIEKIEGLIKENDQELKTSITQNILKDKFFRTRNKGQKLMKIAMYGGVGAFMTCLICIIPYFGLTSFTLSPLGFFAPVAVGALVGTGFAIKREYDYKIVFNKINKTLGANSLLVKANNEEENFYAKSLENKIRNRFMMRTKLEKEKIRLRVIKNRNVSKESNNISRKKEMIKSFDNVKENNISVEEQYQKTKPKVRTRRMDK